MTDATRSHRFFWFDTETTTIEPTQGALLEWALVLAADDELGDFSPVEQYTGVCHFSAETHAEWRHDGLIEDFVERMHTDNGLWAECEQAPVDALADADGFLSELCAELRQGDTSRHSLLRLAGNSVHFDLSWVKVHMPRFASHLSHHVGNVSSLRDFAESWGVTVPETPKPERHRALEDVRATLAFAKACREALGAAPRLAKRVAVDLLPDEYLIPAEDVVYRECGGNDHPLVADIRRIEREGWAAEATLPVIPGVVWK